MSCSEGGALLGEGGKRVVEDEEWLYWSGGMNDVKVVRREEDEEGKKRGKGEEGKKILKKEGRGRI